MLYSMEYQKFMFTIFDKRPEQLRLIALLEDWGFQYYGIKKTQTGETKKFIQKILKKLKILILKTQKDFPV